MASEYIEDNSIDFVLSSDVMEHVSHPPRALKETQRVLKVGGCHIFTAPFYQHRFTNENRVWVDDRGDIRYLRRPWYHLDPMRADDALVYNIFAPELLCQLEAKGFAARLCLVYSPFHGMLGANGIIIVAQKVAMANARDWIFTDDNWPKGGVAATDLAAHVRSQPGVA